MANKPVPTVPKLVQVPEEAPKLSVKLVAITIFYLVVIANAVADAFGLNLHIKADYEGIYEGVTALSYVVALAFAAWKNHNFTKKARIKAEVAKQVDKP
ncbi:holin [Bacillus phage Eldridge]|uniref:Lysis protein n=1 Tax=Bacillus phage Eldridge TaxID=1776293 RepID=A0A0Y0DBJ2_9CAUD|nr:holin [Bacillus phage Eldridge]AMB18712.1 lysis protein [Bacillus phage Eldridge]